MRCRIALTKPVNEHATKGQDRQRGKVYHREERDARRSAFDEFGGGKFGSVCYTSLAQPTDTDAWGMSVSDACICSRCLAGRATITFTTTVVAIVQSRTLHDNYTKTSIQIDT